MNDNHGYLMFDAVADGNGVGQRRLAGEMGVVLGLVNSYVKYYARKGFIKIREVPANRYLYYLTPKGFAEKSRLIARYLTSSFDFYRSTSASCTTLIQSVRSANWTRIVLLGVFELAEITLFVLRRLI